MKSTYNSININFKNAKVLVVEDNDDQWVLIQQAMRQCMSEVTVQRVANLEQALALVEDWRYNSLLILWCGWAKVQAKCLILIYL